MSAPNVASTLASPPVEQDHYAVLESNINTSPEEITHNYHILAQLFRPERHGNRTWAIAAVQRVTIRQNVLESTGPALTLSQLNGAYNVLRDPTSRRAYDIRRVAGQARSRNVVFPDAIIEAHARETDAHAQDLILGAAQAWVNCDRARASISRDEALIEFHRRVEVTLNAERRRRVLTPWWLHFSRAARARAKHNIAARDSERAARAAVLNGLQMAVEAGEARLRGFQARFEDYVTSLELVVAQRQYRAAMSARDRRRGGADVRAGPVVQTRQVVQTEQVVQREPVVRHHGLNGLLEALSTAHRDAQDFPDGHGVQEDLPGRAAAPSEREQQFVAEVRRGLHDHLRRNARLHGAALVVVEEDGDDGGGGGEEEVRQQGSLASRRAASDGNQRAQDAIASAVPPQHATIWDAEVPARPETLSARQEEAVATMRRGLRRYLGPEAVSS